MLYSGEVNAVNTQAGSTTGTVQISEAEAPTIPISGKALW